MLETRRSSLIIKEKKYASLHNCPRRFCFKLFQVVKINIINRYP